jgi:multidrug transporter EmrE-like cation transporter
MKKKILAFLTLMALSANSIFAQNEFIRSLEDIRDDWIRPAYPIVAGIVFIVGALINMGHFFGENRDIKKGISNILVYLGIVLAVIGIFEAITALSI